MFTSSKHQSCGLSWQTHLEQKSGEKRQPVPTLRWKSSLKSTMPGKLGGGETNSEWTAIPRIVLYHEQAHDSNVNHTQRLERSGSECVFENQSSWWKGLISKATFYIWIEICREKKWTSTTNTFITYTRVKNLVLKVFLTAGVEHRDKTTCQLNYRCLHYDPILHMFIVGSSVWRFD